MTSRIPPGIREKRPGYFEVRVYGGVDPITGKPLMITRGVRGLNQAKKLRAELVANGHHGTTGTVSHLFAAVIDHCEHNLRREPQTINGYRIIAKRAGKSLGKVELRKLTAKHLDRFYGELAKDGLSANRIQRYHAFIHRALVQARKWGWVKVNVAEDTTRPEVFVRKFATAEDDKVGALIRAAEKSKNPDLAVAIWLGAAIGLRRGEICGLQWDDIDFDASTATIRRSVKQLPGGRVWVGDVKSHQEGVVDLDPGTAFVLKGLLTRRLEAGVTAPWVLCDETGAHYRPNRLTQAVKRLRERSGYTGRLHDLRHWHASMLLADGEDVVTVANRMRHREATTTLRFYAHAIPGKGAEAAAKIGRRLPARGELGG